MKERIITEEEVRHAVENCQRSFLGKNNHMNYIYTYPTGIRMRVVVHEVSSDYRVVVSVMD